MRKYISSNYRKDKSWIIGLLNMSSSPYRVSQWIVMTKEWIVVRHAHPQVRQCTHHCTQDQPQLFGFKQIYTVCILEKKKPLRWQWFQHTNTNYVMKKRHSEWQVKRCCEWLNVQPYSYHQPVYMQQCPSGCAGQSKILTVLLLAGWNGYSMTLSVRCFIWQYS